MHSFFGSGIDFAGAEEETEQGGLSQPLSAIDQHVNGRLRHPRCGAQITNLTIQTGPEGAYLQGRSPGLKGFRPPLELAQGSTQTNVSLDVAGVVL